jgi:hypothetical protein
VQALRGDFDALHHLDPLDWTISGMAGVLAALVDVFLIQMPGHPAFLGGKAAAAACGCGPRPCSGR